MDHGPTNIDRSAGDSAGLSRSSGRATIFALGDGELEERLRALVRSNEVGADLLTEDVEGIARDFAQVLEQLSTWDDDDAWEVNAAALDYMRAVERFCRNRIEAGL